MDAVARYRMYALWRTQMLGTCVLFAVLAVALIAAAIAGSGPPLAFAVLWSAGVVWTGYWFVFRIIYDLELANGELRWRTPLKRGVESLGDVTELRPFLFGSNIEVVELMDGRRLLVFVRKGFKAFTEELVAARPGLEVRLGLQARMAEKMPGWSGYKGRSD